MGKAFNRKGREVCAKIAKKNSGRYLSSSRTPVTQPVNTGGRPRLEPHLSRMRLGDLRIALGRTYQEVQRNHTMQMAAALSYYSVLSVFPALIFLSAMLAFLPLPDVFNELLPLMERFFPPETMALIQSVLRDVIFSHRATFLSFGMLGTMLAASGGLSAAIEALDMAYDVVDPRPFWKTRVLAVGLTLVIGALLLLGLSVMLAEPRFGEWLAAHVHLSQVFVLLWPYLHWTIAVASVVLAVEALYFLAPNVKQHFLATLPGAVFAVACWIALSYLLGIYFRHFASYNKTYGALGGAIAIMVWMYWTSFAVLAGAELMRNYPK